MSVSRRSYYFLSVCMFGIGLGGCATTGALGKSQESMTKPIKLLLIQSPMTIAPGRLQKVFAPNIKKGLSYLDEPIAQGVSHAQTYLSETMAFTLAKQPGIAVVSPSALEQRYIKEMEGRPYSTAISQEEADKIKRETGADAILKYKITDYGLTPRAWKTGYITFEVTSTLAIAGAIAYAGSTIAKAAAGTYLAQEGVEETAESYAGFWGLDVECRPVRIEAELVQLNPVSIIDSTYDTGLSDVKLSRLVRKVTPSEMDNQLNQATKYAVNDIVTTLSNSLVDIRVAQY